MSHMCIERPPGLQRNLYSHVTLIDDAFVAQDLKFKNELIPTHTIRAAFIAALDCMFADFMTAKEYFSVSFQF